MQCKLQEMIQKFGCLQFGRGWKLLELQNLSIYPRSYQRHQSQKKGHLFSPKLEGQLPTRHMTIANSTIPCSRKRLCLTKQQEESEKKMQENTDTLSTSTVFQGKNQVGRESPLPNGQNRVKISHSLEIFQFSCPENKSNPLHPRSTHLYNQVWAQGTTKSLLQQRSMSLCAQHQM